MYILSAKHYCRTSACRRIAAPNIADKQTLWNWSHAHRRQLAKGLRWHSFGAGYKVAQFWKCWKQEPLPLQAHLSHLRQKIPSERPSVWGTLSSGDLSRRTMRALKGLNVAAASLPVHFFSLGLCRPCWDLAKRVAGAVMVGGRTRAMRQSCPKNYKW